MPTYEEVRERFERENRMNIFEQAVEDACQKIMRQTDYDKEISLQKLKEHDLDIIEIVREWMGVPIKKQVKRTTNQMVFDEFRSFLDDAANKYYKKKDAEERQQAFIQQARTELMRRASTANQGSRSQPTSLETVEEASDEQSPGNSSDNLSSNPDEKH